MLMAMRENGHDIISCFVPIVLQAVPSYDFTDCTTINHDLADFAPMPELMVKKILVRAVEEGYVETIQRHDLDLFKLKADTVVHFIEEQKTVKKRVDGLVQDIDSYFVNQSYKVVGPILGIIDSFIDACGFEISMTPPYTVKSTGELKTEKKGLRLLFDYLRSAQNRNSIHLNTFKEVVMGKIISTVFDFPSFSEIKLESFDSCQLFLDTNFIFSILGLHEPSISKPALTLFQDYLKRFSFKMNVFDFTKEQICMVLRSYSPEAMKRVPDSALPSIYSTLKRKGWTKEQVNTYANNIESKLKENGIEVVHTDIVLSHSLLPKDKTIADLMKVSGPLLTLRKPYSSEFGKQHDVAAIIMIEKIRGGHKTEVKNVTAFFLTSDHQLEKFNKFDMKHNENKTISEVILDTDFTSLLWILSPKLHPEPFSLETIIAAFSMNWFASEELWKKFSLVLESVLRKKGISVEEVSSICYYNISSILKAYPDDKVVSFTPEYIEARIEEASIEEARRKQKDGAMQLLIDEKNIAINLLKSEIEKLRSVCEKLEEDNNGINKKMKKVINKIAKLKTFLVISCISTTALTILVLYLLL